MLDKTIDSALCQLRATIIREGQDGLSHVEALLSMRGVVLPHVPRKIPDDSCACGELKLIVLAAIRDGPKTTGEIIAWFMAVKPHVPRALAMQRAYRAIYRMRDGGVVRCEGRLWGLK